MDQALSRVSEQWIKVISQSNSQSVSQLFCKWYGLVWSGCSTDLHGPVTKLTSANAAISKTAVTVTSLNSGCCVDSDGRLVTLPVKTPLFAEL